MNARTEGSVNEWWSDLDDDLLATLGAGGAMTPVELGLRLGISEAAIASLVAMLATEGRVRICLVERRDATTSTVALVPEAVVALQFLDRRQGEWSAPIAWRMQSASMGSTGGSCTSWRCRCPCERPQRPGTG